MNKRQKQRLLNVAKALRESKEPKDFNMTRFGNVCGTPACALGHYASRPDLQKAFVLGMTEGDALHNRAVLAQNPEVPDFYLAKPAVRDKVTFEAIFYGDGPLENHFGITTIEVEELFCSNGCGNAQTTKQAASYIERFVARKEKSQ